VLETSVYEHVTSSTEIRMTTTTTSRRGRPPRNNKRSLTDVTDGGSSNNKRVCIFETENVKHRPCDDNNGKHRQQCDDNNVDTWEEENVESPASQNSLLSNNTDFSSIELDETGDTNTGQF
jgi:hypothetical protein